MTIDVSAIKTLTAENSRLRKIEQAANLVVGEMRYIQGQSELSMHRHNRWLRKLEDALKGCAK